MQGCPDFASCTAQHPRVKLTCQIPEHPIEDRGQVDARWSHLHRRVCWRNEALLAQQKAFDHILKHGGRDALCIAVQSGRC